MSECMQLTGSRCLLFLCVCYYLYKNNLSQMYEKKYRLRVGQIFEFVKLILFLKMFLGGGLAPSSQTVGSLLIPPGWQSRSQKWTEHGSNGFDNSKIQPTQTKNVWQNFLKFSFTFFFHSKFNLSTLESKLIILELFWNLSC